MGRISMLQSQIHYQQQILSAAMRQSLKSLQLSMSGLQTELVRFAEENPMVDLDQFYSEWQWRTSDGNMMLYEDFSGSLFERPSSTQKASYGKDLTQISDSGSNQQQENVLRIFEGTTPTNFGISSILLYSMVRVYH